MKKKILIGMAALLIGGASFLNFGSVAEADADTSAATRRYHQFPCIGSSYTWCGLWGNDCYTRVKCYYPTKE